MRIIVAIKQIQDPAGIVVNRRRERIFINREEYIINPVDRSALELALRLKDAQGAEVIALSAGPVRVEDALREALAMGADAAYLLTGKPVERADLPGVSRALTAAIEHIGATDLVMAGATAIDTGGAQLGGRLAALLSLPQLTNVVSLSAQDGHIAALRQMGTTYERVLMPLPAVAIVSPDAPAGRLPHGGRIMNAYRQWSITTWTIEDLGLEKTSLQRIIESRGVIFPPERELGVRLAGSLQEMAADVMRQIRVRRLI